MQGGYWSKALDYLFFPQYPELSENYKHMSVFLAKFYRDFGAALRG